MPLASQAYLYGLLEAHKVFETLKAYDPHWVGSAALDIHIEDSDIDICCHAKPDLRTFKASLEKAFGHYPGFQVQLETFGGQPSCVSSFQLDDEPLHVWGRAHPVEQHEFYRMYKVTEACLRLGGERLQTDLRAAKKRGFKTEPALAKCLGLGEPAQETVLKLYQAPASAYLTLLKSAGYL